MLSEIDRAMFIEQATLRMSVASNLDRESGHIQADEILLDILRVEGGYDELIEIYDNMQKWYA